MFLNGIDRVTAVIPELLIDLVDSFKTGDTLIEDPLRIDFRCKHIFIMRPIEDLDHATLGQCIVVTPEVIMLQLVLCRCLEAVYTAPLRVDARHHMTDHSILAGSITCRSEEH